jgi:hypothetical protein
MRQYKKVKFSKKFLSTKRNKKTNKKVNRKYTLVGGAAAAAASASIQRFGPRFGPLPKPLNLTKIPVHLQFELPPPGTLAKGTITPGHGFNTPRQQTTVQQTIAKATPTRWQDFKKGASKVAGQINPFRSSKSSKKK